MQVNSRSIDSHIGGGDLGYLGIIASSTEHAVVAPEINWINPAFPGRSPATIDNGTVAQIFAERHILEEATEPFKPYITLYQALKKHIITIFETMYLKN